MRKVQSPEWLKKARFYEIYPQSFYDTNGDGIGDLKGIIAKLDYLLELGFNAIWINPMYLSPFYDAGYDVTDFYKVAPRYGTNADCYRLFREAHKRGMHVLLDLVPGHTAIDSEWFRKSCLQKQNEYSDRFIWTKSVWETEEDIPCIRGFYPRNGSVVTNFFSIQPALNYGFYEIRHPEYEETIDGKGPQATIKSMLDVMRFWLDKGADGFRVDMAGWLVKRDPESKGTKKVWERIFPIIKKEYPEAAFVSEWNNPIMSLDSGFDMDFLLQDTMNYPMNQMTRDEHAYFRDEGICKDPTPFMDHFLKMYESAKKNKAYLAMISGNHDTIRIRRTLSEEEMKRYYVFMFTLPSVPFLYYGDEIGMKYEENLVSVEGGYQRTGSRSPMQWKKGKMGGFTTSNQPYITINPDRKGISVEEEEKKKDSLLNFLKNLLKIRSEHVALDNDARLGEVSYGKGQVLSYLRSKDKEKIYVFLNLNPESKHVLLKKGVKDILLADQVEIKDGEAILGPNGYLVIR